jgi:hypothetical protein
VALVGGYSFAVKNIVGGYGERFGIGVATIGFLVGLTGLGRAIGSKLYAEFPVRNIAVPSIIFVFSVVGIGVFPGIVPVVTCLLLTQILAGYLGSKIDGDIHEAASDHTRASLFSLKRVSMKLTTSGYLAVYGIALGISQATILAYLTGILLLSAFIYSWQYLRGHDSLK